MKSEEIAAAIMQLETLDDLRVIDNTLKIRWRMVTDLEALAAMKKLLPGTRVKFKSRKGILTKDNIKYGTVVSLAQKNVKVNIDNEGIWRVYAGLLEVVQEGAKQ